MKINFFTLNANIRELRDDGRSLGIFVEGGLEIVKDRAEPDATWKRFDSKDEGFMLLRINDLKLERLKSLSAVWNADVTDVALWLATFALDCSAVAMKHLREGLLPPSSSSTSRHPGRENKEDSRENDLDNKLKIA